MIPKGFWSPWTKNPSLIMVNPPKYAHPPFSNDLAEA